MVDIIITDPATGEEVFQRVEDSTWRAIQKRPQIIGMSKSVRLAPKVKIIKEEAPPPLQKSTTFTEAYYYDCMEKAKTYSREGNKKEALIYYEEAEKYKNTPYLKGRINKIKKEL